MMKIKKYEIVRNGSATSLTQTIEKLSAEGWQLHGNLSHSVVWAIDPTGRPNGRILNELYVQAMVLPDFSL